MIQDSKGEMIFDKIEGFIERDGDYLKAIQYTITETVSWPNRENQDLEQKNQNLV